MSNIAWYIMRKVYSKAAKRYDLKLKNYIEPIHIDFILNYNGRKMLTRTYVLL